MKNTSGRNNSNKGGRRGSLKKKNRSGDKMRRAEAAMERNRIDIPE
jgi:hypothetical protein